MKHVFIVKGLEKEEGIIKYGEMCNLVEDLLSQLTKPIKLHAKRFDTKLVIKVKSNLQAFKNRRINLPMALFIDSSNFISSSLFSMDSIFG